MEIAIGTISVLLGMTLSYFAFMRNRDKDTIAKAKEEAQLDTDLRYISRGVDEIRVDMKTNSKQMDRMQEQLIRIDESTKSAHKRLDIVERKIN